MSLAAQHLTVLTGASRGMGLAMARHLLTPDRLLLCISRRTRPALEDLARLRSKVEYTSLPAFLLPEPFTLPQLQQVYEVVLGRALDKSAFRKRMLDSGFLAEVGTVDGTAPRKAMGYRIRDRSQATVFPRTFRSGES